MRILISNKNKIKIIKFEVKIKEEKKKRSFSGVPPLVLRPLIITPFDFIYKKKNLYSKVDREFL